MFATQHSTPSHTIPSSKTLYKTTPSYPPLNRPQQRCITLHMHMLFIYQVGCADQPRHAHGRLCQIPPQPLCCAHHIPKQRYQATGRPFHSRHRHDGAAPWWYDLGKVAIPHEHHSQLGVADEGCKVGNGVVQSTSKCTFCSCGVK